jgi:hypothetical protein
MPVGEVLGAYDMAPEVKASLIGIGFPILSCAGVILKAMNIEAMAIKLNYQPYVFLGRFLKDNYESSPSTHGLTHRLPNLKGKVSFFTAGFRNRSRINL